MARASAHCWKKTHKKAFPSNYAGMQSKAVVKGKIRQLFKTIGSYFDTNEYSSISFPFKNGSCVSLALCAMYAVNVLNNKLQFEHIFSFCLYLAKHACYSYI